MQALARLERIDSKTRRSSPRRQLSLGAVLPDTGDEVVIHDLSTTGILIKTGADLVTFEQLQLDLPEAGPVVATVIWRSGEYFGCEFHQPLPQAAISAALLRSPFLRATPAPVASAIDEDDAEGVVDDRYSFGARLRVILGASVLLWGLIFWAAGVL